MVYVVHSVDTEGPLIETLEGTFERLYEIFRERLDPSKENLKKIQNRELDFGEKTDEVARVFNDYNLNYHDSWEKIDSMLMNMMSLDFRNKLKDSFGGGWIYNWHCLDHVGYESNPRGRDLGFHKIFDHYRHMIEKTQSYQDGLHWHFHPMSIYKEAHRCASSYVNSPHLYEILCRRIIERNWFPTVFRPGFHVERPDSHWFLEQWIPFDIANWSHNKTNRSGAHQSDLDDGRFRDWRLAPIDWSTYHPSHDNYQVPGTCRRWICRVQSITVRDGGLTQDEVDKAFARANEGKPTIMAITNHDFRDMATEVDFTRELIFKASRMYSDVKFKFSEAAGAFREALYDDHKIQDKIKLRVCLESYQKSLKLMVSQEQGQVFGPQPFLAVRTKTGRYIHDNFDFDVSLKKWSYTFGLDSIHADDIDAIGVAANDKYGHCFIKVLRP
ncbi:MAG: hypothetical protein HYS98_00360 [Deltaproteobacteria bacterium]|nr:hypothetical protein [Deltaproteobacteria bacterium]